MPRFLLPIAVFLIALGAVISLPTRAIANLSLEGACVDGMQWTATLLNQGAGGTASYSMCALPKLPSASFSCSSPGTTVEMHVVMTLPSFVQAGDVLRATADVDGNAFPLTGTAQPLDFDGGLNPVFTVEKTAPLWGAMQRGTAAKLDVAGRTFEMHLSGASDGIGGMLEGCGVF